MNFKRTTYCFLVGLLATSVCRPASADLVLTFSIDSGANFSNSFDVMTGDSLSIGVYLNETAPDTILADEGFFGFGLTAVAAPTGFGTISAASILPLYDFNTIDEFTASTIDWEAAIFLNDIPVGPSHLLGTFQFDTTVDGSTVITFADRLPGTGTPNVGWLSGFGNELDQLIFGAGATDTFDLTITAIAIPEPGSCVLLAVALIGITFRRRRRVPGT